MRCWFFSLFIFLFFSTTIYADQLIIEPDAGRAPILSAIKQAKSIDVVMYGLTDDRCIDALNEAHNQGKQVRILLEPSPYKSAGENNKAIQALQNENIPLHWPSHQFQLTHQKTFILDQHSAIIMTFNLTHSTFLRERNFALIITDPERVNEIERVFSADWSHQAINVSQPDLVWSPDNSREKIISLIKQAHSEIDIYAQDISDYQTIGELAKAARSGVEIKIILSAENNERRAKKLNFLKSAGIDIRVSKQYVIHAKVFIIDNTSALIGSINLTKASIDKNRELAVITKDPHVLNQLRQTFDDDWNQTNSKPRPKKFNKTNWSLIRKIIHQIEYFL